MERTIYTHCNLAFFGLIAIFTGAGGLRDVTLQVPLAVPAGSTASFLCMYDLEGDQLYQVKWYKGRQEFFRYIWKELPHTRVFPLPGINVDVVASGTEMVVLTNVQKVLTGKYRCEVSTDAPHFHTVVVSSYMNVIDELLEEPVIRLEKNSYSIGDTLRGNCSSPPTSPPANITWYLNGEKENSSAVYFSVVSNSTAAVTTADLAVELSSANFPGGKLRLRCEADLFSTSRTVRELWLDEDRPRLASVRGSRDSAGRASSSTTLLQMATVVSLLYSCR